MKFNLDNLVEEFNQLEKELSNPEIFSDQKKVKKVSSAKKAIEEAVSLYKEYKEAYQTLEEAKIMLEDNDPEMKELAKAEKSEAESTIERLEEELKIALLPKDPNDDKNIMLEVRAGT